MNHISKTLFYSFIITCLMTQLFSSFTQPEGGRVNGGQATINSSANNVTIKQTSDKTVIDWSKFSIGSNETVQFIQPSASAIVLIRIHDLNASTIDGQLLANGNVWLLNSNGVIFGSKSQVSVGGY